MATTFRAHFDGKVIVPDEAIDLEPGAEVVVSVVETPETQVESFEERRRRQQQALREFLGNLPNIKSPEGFYFDRGEVNERE